MTEEFNVSGSQKVNDEYYKPSLAIKIKHSTSLSTNEDSLS
jgi:hypothetical protein